MNIHDYAKIMEKHKEFKMLKRMTAIQWRNALIYVAIDCEIRDFVAFYDWGTLFKTGKYGVCVAMDAVYFRYSNKEDVLKVNLDGLVKVFCEKENSNVDRICFQYKDGVTERYFMKLPKRDSLIEMLNEIAVMYNSSIHERKEMSKTREKAQEERTDKNKKVIVTDRCIGCLACANYCPVGAIGEKKGKAYVRQDECVQCGECESVCPIEGIIVNKK